MKVISAVIVALLILYFIDTQFGTGRYVAAVFRMARGIARAFGL